MFDRACLLMALACSSVPAWAEEFRPVAVRTYTACFPNPPGRYAADKMIDNDLGTYACLLDDTRTGNDARVYPPRAAPPVTAAFVLDLGEDKTVSGMRFVARNAWVYVSPKNVSVAACADARGQSQLRQLVKSKELPATSNSNSAFVEWPAVTTRYLLVNVHDSFQQRYPNSAWLYEAQIPWCRKVGLPTAGDGRNLNIQIAEITCYDARPCDYPGKNPPDVAFPRHRLERDWLYQDAGLDIARVFTSPERAEKECAMVQKVLGRIPATGAAGLQALWKRLEDLDEGQVPARDPRWRALYLDACAARRQARLQSLRARATQFVYVKHGIFGCMQGLAGKYDIPDEQIRDFTPGFKRGGQLCLGTLIEDGSVKHEVMLEKPAGAICYPSLSWDAKTVVFSMRDNFDTDSYYLYTLDLTTRRVRQITFSIVKDGKTLHVADCEPVCMPDGSIVFTRWEYNDRTALYLHPLIVMNPDGTSHSWPD